MYKESYNTQNFSKNMERELLDIQLPSNQNLLEAIENLEKSQKINPVDEEEIESQAEQLKGQKKSYKLNWIRKMRK